MAYEAMVMVAWSSDNTDDDGAQCVAMVDVAFMSSRAKERRESDTTTGLINRNETISTSVVGTVFARHSYSTARV